MLSSGPPDGGSARSAGLKRAAATLGLVVALCLMLVSGRSSILIHLSNEEKDDQGLLVLRHDEVSEETDVEPSNTALEQPMVESKEPEETLPFAKTTPSTPSVDPVDSTSGIYQQVLTRPQARCPNNQRNIVMFFPHVNKAGGRTIEATFAGRKRRIFRPIMNNIRSHTKTYRLEDGHRTYEDLKQQAMRESSRLENEGNESSCVRWVFFARHPFDRTLSAFHTTTGRALEQTSLDLQQNHFPCTSETLRLMLTNSSFTFEDFARLPKEERDTCERDVHVHYLGGPQKDLELAKQRVLEMDAVGLVEEFAQSMQLMNWELGLDLLLYTPVFNKNDHEKQVSDQARRVLEELNTLDLQLYEFVKEQVFKPRMEAMRKYFKGTFPWKDSSSAASCDKKLICWDRRKSASIIWDVKDEFPVGAPGEDDLVDIGIQKQYVICGPLRGCSLSPRNTTRRRRRRLYKRITRPSERR